MEVWYAYGDGATVRDAEPADAESLVRILNPIMEARVSSAFDTPFSIEAERDYLVNFAPRGIWKVAIRLSDDALVGFQVLEPFATSATAFNHVGTLGTYVDLDVRRQGAGQAAAATLKPRRRRDTRKSPPWSAPTTTWRCRPISVRGFG